MKRQRWRSAPAADSDGWRRRRAIRALGTLRVQIDARISSQIQRGSEREELRSFTDGGRRRATAMARRRTVTAAAQEAKAREGVGTRCEAKGG
jgi:hypothetical protein